VKLLANGQPLEIGAGATVDSVLAHLEVGRRGIAVAVNGAVIPQSAWDATYVAEGDRVEVLSAAQGG
jgi:sulfur carrier protein